MEIFAGQPGVAGGNSHFRAKSELPGVAPWNHFSPGLGPRPGPGAQPGVTRPGRAGLGPRAGPGWAGPPARPGGPAGATGGTAKMALLTICKTPGKMNISKTHETGNPELPGARVSIWQH